MLDIGGLVRTANASKLLVDACFRVFKDKFSNTKIEVPLNDIDDEEYGNCLVPLFKNFGHLILKLSINYDVYHDVVNELMHTLSIKHCSDTLTELEISEPRSNYNFVKPFPNLKSLIFRGGSLHGSVLRFGEWCPRIESLACNYVQNFSKIFDAQQTISTLKSFSLNHSIRAADKSETISMRKLNNFILLNPQLTELSLNIIEDMIPSGGRSKVSHYQYVFSHEPLTLKIMMEDCPDGLKHLAVPHDRIAHLDINCDFVDKEILKFIAKCRNLKILKILSTCNEFFSKKAWKSIAKKLPKLTEISGKIFHDIDLGNGECEITDHSLIGFRPFFVHCKQLKSIQFHSDNQFRYYDADDFTGNECDDIKDDLMEIENLIKNEMDAWSLAYEVQIVKGYTVSYKYTLTK